MFAPSINVDFSKLQQEEAEEEQQPRVRKGRAVPRGQRKRGERAGKDED